MYYRSLMNIKSKFNELNPSQKLVIVGIRGGNIPSGQWKYISNTHNNEQGEKFTKAINNIMFAYWLLSSRTNQ